MMVQLLLPILAVLAAPSATPAWEPRLTELRDDTGALHESLRSLQERLLPRVQREAPHRVPDLALIRPVQEGGWGLLPPLTEPEPARPYLPVRRSYSLAGAEAFRDSIRSDMRSLTTDVDSDLATEALVDRYAESRDNLQILANHVAYHEQWQHAVLRYPIYFMQRNRLLPLAAELAELAQPGESPAEAERIRSRLLDQVATFTPTPGLSIEVRDGQPWILPVSICTDIEDREFLQQAQYAIERRFKGHISEGTGVFELRLDWRVIPIDHLYPEDPPGIGDTIDLDEHVARFEGCPFVFSTGAASTHAQVGRYVLLGSGSMAPGVLAHEFAHLLGFEDAYLRGYEGDPFSENGAELIEWWGLSDDLMGDSDHGAVSPRMLRTLIEAYGPDAAPP